jgi:FtsP/CotA-like multicopper oxidase with cupredoxin domain
MGDSVNSVSRKSRNSIVRGAFLLFLTVFSVMALALSACRNNDGVSELPYDPTPEQIGPSGHEGEEGLVLGPDNFEESVYAGSRCDANAPIRLYDVVVIDVQITLNRYLDYDPKGRMYVLEEELDRVRDEEAQNQAARKGEDEPAVSFGLQGDAIQPLILRVNQGECLQINLRNQFRDDIAASLHVHGSSMHMIDTGSPAIATNLESMVWPGHAVGYQWMVEEEEPEGTHYFHSHGDDRAQTNHGLFGAVIVEPRDSEHVDPLTGDQLRSGWAAIIQYPGGSDFREFAIVYHEIGNERYRHLNRRGNQVPLVDPLTNAYKPGGRALNYRSEPFMNRMELQQQTSQFFDQSQAYSSYTFGEPSTPIARTYIGDPVKQRVIHGGSEVFHVHHSHGGSIRWRRQPGVEPTAFDSGFDKNPPVVPRASSRIDSQSIGPSENYDIENECGSGGCQESVGDYLVHCHVAHHYIAGMWMIWRVYNTLQNDLISQDNLPPLARLSDKNNRVISAVTSEELVGKKVDWKGSTYEINEDNLSDWVERQLPPQGTAKGYDASVLDWQREGSLYLNEPETTDVWPGYASSNTGLREPFYFDSKTGKLAYPFLKPHLGKRPPFAPNHGPAPFLDPIHTGTDPPKAGENGESSLCPAGTKMRNFVIHAINLPLELSRRANILDPVSQLYVLKEEEDSVRASNGLKTPLAIRANAAEDCVDIIFKSELEDTGENNFFSKTNIHVHFVQFDVQASDGVSTGFNYEQSIRPFTVEGEILQDPVLARDKMVRLGSAERFQPGILVGIGMDQAETFEVHRIVEISGDTLILEEPLKYPHSRGEIVSTEFVRYRWYPDVQFGTAYFHDHVSALTSWRHGLFGALVSEPAGSTYHDPHTGQQVRSGPIVDVRTDTRVSADVSGSFREMVLFIQDGNPLTQVGDSSGSSYNLRVEPLAARGGDPWQLFDSEVHGDPQTPLLEAFLGDPIVIRALVAASNDVHTFHVDGHWFRAEPWSVTSPPINTVHLGISERYDLVIPSAGGPQQMPGDYLYRSGRSFKLKEGSWGILRVLEDIGAVELQKLPGRDTIPEASSSVCPRGSPEKTFDILAIETSLPMLDGVKGKLYVLAGDKEDLLNGNKSPEPLTLHINVGDCLKVNLTNETQGGPVTFHVDGLGYAPGVVGEVFPTESQTYFFFAHPEIGETVGLLRDSADVLRNPGLGLYGAIIVGPRGSTYTHPESGEDMSGASSWRVDVHPLGEASYRDFTFMIQDEDEVIGTAIMPYTEHVEGVVGLNYKNESLLDRLLIDADTSRLFNSDVHGDPATPLAEAFVGDPVRFHVLVPFSEQAHVFTVEGHRWPLESKRLGSDILSAIQLGGLEAITIILENGAGGRGGMPGDYLYGDHREPYREAGLWGLFRVYPRSSLDAGLLPLVHP